eukprot:SAG11_NODE_202_length_12550_cov_5.549835_5_plen_320_part_00
MCFVCVCTGALRSTTDEFLVLPSGTLEPGMSYTFRIRGAVGPGFGQISSIGHASMMLSTRRPPHNRFDEFAQSLSPSSGMALSTAFTLSAGEHWVAQDDEGLPLTYSFGYYDGQAFNPLTATTASDSAVVFLPSGSADASYDLQVGCTVYDSLGEATRADATVRVSPLPAEQLAALVTQRLATAEDFGSSELLLQTSVAAATGMVLAELPLDDSSAIVNEMVEAIFRFTLPSQIDPPATLVRVSHALTLLAVTDSTVVRMSLFRHVCLCLWTIVVASSLCFITMIVCVNEGEAPMPYRIWRHTGYGAIQNAAVPVRPEG